MKILVFCLNVSWWRSVRVSVGKSKVVGEPMGGGFNKIPQISFLIVTM